MCVFVFQPPAGLSVLRLEKNLTAQLEKLNAEKNERLKKAKNLKDQDQHLCDVLCVTPFYIPSGTVPSLEQLSNLEQHIASLTKEKVCSMIYFSLGSFFDIFDNK